MATFSWSDTFHIAFSSCFACLPQPVNLEASASTDSLVNNPAANRIPRARADELHGLLAESDAEAERMSLHSNPGKRRKRTKRKKDKRITFFGYDLFGHATPPIHLPESDDEDGGRGLDFPTPTTRSSSLTFDSDAAPLDSSTIADISSSSAALRARKEVQEAERREKAERRERRRQRKELKKMAKALALAEQEEQFEGFQGSGSGFQAEEYGPFIHAEPCRDGEDVDEDADLDGGVYARKSNSGAGSGSDSRSRTSASRSQQSHNDDFASHQPPSRSRTSASRSQQSHNDAFASHQPPLTSLMGPPPPRSKTSKSRSSATSRSTTSRVSRSNSSRSTSESLSLPSPVSPTFSGSDRLPKPKLSIVDDFDGSQGLSEADLPSPRIRGGFPSTGLQGVGFPSQTFPSSGFGRPKNLERRDSILTRGGAFLATRGSVDEFEG